MKKPRTTRKPIPGTIPEWVKELEGIRAFLDKTDRLIVENGQAWVDSMCAYNRRREGDLLAHPPKGIRVSGGNYYRVKV